MERAKKDICKNFCGSIINVLNSKLLKYGKKEIEKQLKFIFEDENDKVKKIMDDIKPITDSLGEGSASSINKEKLRDALKKTANHRWVPNHPFFMAGTKKILLDCAKVVDKKIKE